MYRAHGEYVTEYKCLFQLAEEFLVKDEKEVRVQTIVTIVKFHEAV